MSNKKRNPRQNLYQYFEDVLCISVEDLSVNLMNAKEVLSSYIAEDEKNIKKLKLKSKNNKIKDQELSFLEEDLKSAKYDSEQINKFVDFLNSEEERYEEVFESKKVDKFLQKNGLDDPEDYFEKIEFIPAYLDKYCGLKVKDFIRVLDFLLNDIKIIIEEILNVDLPEKINTDLSNIIIHKIRRNKINLEEEESDLLFYLVDCYAEVEFLKNVLIEEITILESPYQKK